MVMYCEILRRLRVRTFDTYNAVAINQDRALGHAVADKVRGTFTMPGNICLHFLTTGMTNTGRMIDKAISICIRYRQTII
jgi:hypothetical protein